jgi:hypothetical protein
MVVKLQVIVKCKLLVIFIEFLDSLNTKITIIKIIHIAINKIN